MDKVSNALSKSVIFYQEDFVAVGKRVENCVGNSAKNWVEESEQRIDVENIVLAAQDQTDFKKS